MGIHLKNKIHDTMWAGVFFVCWVILPLLVGDTSPIKNFIRNDPMKKAPLDKNE